MWPRLRATARRLRALRRTIPATRPDVVVSSLQHVNVLTLLALTGKAMPVVVVEQNNPSMLSLGMPWNWLRRVTYPRAARLVSVSQGVDRYFDWLRPAQRTVIHNPLTPDYENAGGSPLPVGVRPGRKLLVAMGRLTHVKGFDLLLAAFAGVAEKHQDWDLVIIGEGELRSKLEAQREQLGLSQRVLLPGQLTNPFPLLRRAQLFVLPSRSEGFPNVLIEAMACGVPVIATDCQSGPREIVRDGENGVLVAAEDVGALAAALERLMADDAERARLSGNPDEVQELFGIKKITEVWEQLLQQVLAERAHDLKRELRQRGV
jgi:glycosyltransferase involved in cell wall biosynthesis